MATSSKKGHGRQGQAAPASFRTARPATPAAIMAPRIALIVITIVLVVFGLVMVYSASSILGLNNYGDSAYYVKNQLKFLAIGAVVLIVVARLPYRLYSGKMSWVAWAVVTGVLAVTLVAGTVGLGAKRWIYIGSFGFQPGELAKIAIMLVGAYLACQFHEYGVSRRWLVKVITVVALPVLFILLQPDLGTTIIALVGVLAVLWFGGFPRKWVAILVAAMLVIGVAFIAFESFRQDRIAAFLNPWADPLGNGYQIINSYYAFSGGGVTGVGLGMSRQKYLYLPEAQNDFIFSIIGEELGLIGALFVIALFVALVVAGFQIARHARDLQGRVIAGTASTLLGFQAFLNIACTVGLMPITGKPLPFISSGGTSLIVSLLQVGLILSVSLHSVAPDAAQSRRDELVVIDGGARSNQAPRSYPQTRRSPAPAYARAQGGVYAEKPAPRPARYQPAYPESRPSPSRGGAHSGSTPRIARANSGKVVALHRNAVTRERAAARTAASREQRARR